jgi:AbrB family looped-hinge helix DNA binding protein
MIHSAVVCDSTLWYRLTLVLLQDIGASMSVVGRVKSQISSKGQVVIPKLIRESLGFTVGSEVEFVEHAEGVLLRRPTHEKKYTLDDLLNALPRYNGSQITEEMMQAGIEAAARERWVQKEKNSRQ